MKKGKSDNKLQPELQLQQRRDTQESVEQRNDLQNSFQFNPFTLDFQGPSRGVEESKEEEPYQLCLDDFGENAKQDNNSSDDDNENFKAKSIGSDELLEFVLRK